MAKGGRVQHWKHGWIPRSPQAKAFVAGKGPNPTATDLKPPPEALKRARERQAKAKSLTAANQAADVKSKQSGYHRLTTVDGYPNVYFKEPLSLNRRPPEQYREVAKIVTDRMKPYPQATQNHPVEIGFSNELDSTVMADTSALGLHPIRVNVDMWDLPNRTMRQVKDMQERHFGITAEASDLATFRSNVITHELGHYLHMRNRDDAARKARVDLLRDPVSIGEIDKFTDQTVTPRQMGWSAESDHFLDEPFTRWRVDSLNRQSTYALTDPFEFYAEAFLDGTINGDKASDSGKQAVALAHDIFGGAA